jgi:hypothetical protein
MFLLPEYSVEDHRNLCSAVCILLILTWVYWVVMNLGSVVLRVVSAGSAVVGAGKGAYGVGKSAYEASRDGFSTGSGLASRVQCRDDTGAGGGNCDGMTEAPSFWGSGQTQELRNHLAAAADSDRAAAVAKANAGYKWDSVDGMTHRPAYVDAMTDNKYGETSLAPGVY